MEIPDYATSELDAIEEWSPEFAGIVEKPVEQEEPEPSVELSPEQRIANLIEGLPGQKELLFAIIDFCRTPQTPEAVDKKTAEIQADKHSVYSAVVLRKLLQEAGALSYLEQETADADTQVPDDPDFLVVKLRATGLWVATDAGLAIVDSFDVISETEQLLAQDSDYLTVYRDILAYCADEPRTQKELDVLVQENPVTHSPRKYGGYFIDRLEACGAIVWKQKWQPTTDGLEILKRLTDKQVKA